MSVESEFNQLTKNKNMIHPYNIRRPGFIVVPIVECGDDVKATACYQFEMIQGVARYNANTYSAKVGGQWYPILAIIEDSSEELPYVPNTQKEFGDSFQAGFEL